MDDEYIDFDNLVWTDFKTAPVYGRTLVVRNLEGIDYVELYLTYRNFEETVTITKYIGHVKNVDTMTFHNVAYVESVDNVLKIYIKPLDYDSVIQVAISVVLSMEYNELNVDEKHPIVFKLVCVAKKCRYRDNVAWLSLTDCIDCPYLRVYWGR